MGPGMRGRIEAIDPRPTVSPALLASVKALLEGDGFCRLKYWINGAEVTAGPSTVSSPLGCVYVCICERERELEGVLTAIPEAVVFCCFALYRWLFGKDTNQ